eukprot:9503830-Pyramimonas_sp.AAC.7
MHSTIRTIRTNGRPKRSPCCFGPPRRSCTQGMVTPDNWEYPSWGTIFVTCASQRTPLVVCIIMRNCFHWSLRAISFQSGICNKRLELETRGAEDLTNLACLCAVADRGCCKQAITGELTTPKKSERCYKPG